MVRSLTEIQRQDSFKCAQLWGPEITSFEINECISIQPAVMKLAISIEESCGLALLKKLRVTETGASQLVFTCMGDAGQWSRMASKAIGSFWSYYCLPEAKPHLVK